nr:hypothetical protein B0A51_04544 [Rachicladosporium sp. CCFEE 5018]
MPFWKGKDYAHAKDCAQYIEAVVGGSIVMPQAIAVFATSHLNDPGQTGSSEATERKRVADGLLFASGRLTDTIINTIIKIAGGGLVGNRNERGTKAADYSTNAQSATLSYLRHTITRLVSVSGKMAAWKAVTDVEIEIFLRNLRRASAHHLQQRFPVREQHGGMPPQIYHPRHGFLKPPCIEESLLGPPPEGP